MRQGKKIGIVGVGPRGLSVLERLISHVDAHSLSCQVLLVEPECLGVGAHHRGQPDYLLLNTVAGQVTAFSDQAMVPGAPVTRGPSFLDWCRERGARAPEGWWAGGGRLVEAADFMPRRTYGEYLAWSAEELLRRAPPGLEVVVAGATAVDVRPACGGAEVHLEDGAVHTVDLAIVTTGHGLSPPALREGPRSGWIDRPYPLPESVALVRPRQRLAVLGAGLTAIDLVATLTVGRGGAFRVGAGALEYDPSGEEPEIVLLNRSGWLPCARPAVPRSRASSGGNLEAAVGRLRRRRESGALARAEDFERLVVSEVLAGVADEGEAVFLERAFGLQPPPSRSWAEFEAAVVEQARLDVEAARRGLGRSPLKDRLETLRDQREAALANRTAVGPQRERLEELLCLIELGIVRLGPGRAPEVRQQDGAWQLRSTSLQEGAETGVDIVVKGHLEFPGRDPAVDPLGHALRRWVAPHPADPRFLSLDRCGRPVTRDGRSCEAVAVFGPPAEGASYNNYVLWPGTWSRLLTDIDRVLAPLLKA